MKFSMISKCGEGAGLLYKIQEEGNDCKIFIKEKDYSTVYDGVLPKVSLKEIENSDVIIFDSNGMGDVAEEFKKFGKFVFSGSLFQDKLENDRLFGLQFMDKCRIHYPFTQEFNSFEEGRKFIIQNPERYVFKPCGDLPSKLTYVSCDASDCLNYIDFVEKSYSSRVTNFVLQEFIKGTIVSSEFWCGKNGFVWPCNQTVEVKKFMNDDLGPSTGCSGNLVWLAKESSSIIKEGISRAEEFLKDEGYIGPIDLNTIFTEDEVLGLEWTPRFGLDAMPSLLELFINDVGKTIYELCTGECKYLPLIDKFSAGVRITIPPYPIEPKDVKVVQDVSPNLYIPIDLEEGYFYEIMEKDGEIVHSDGTGVIACVSRINSDCEKGFEDVYSILEESKIPDKQYRTDLGKVLSEMYEEVKENELCLT